MYGRETEDGWESPQQAYPGRYIAGPLGWIGVICIAPGLFGFVAADIGLTGWLFALAILMAGPVLVFLDLNGQVTEVRSELGGGVQRRAIEYLILAGIALLYAALLLRLDAAQPAPRDLSPDAVVERGPDRVNPGCPVRTWSPGDYVPEACLDRHTYTRLAYYEGVESLWYHRGSVLIHTRQWTRLGRDLAGGPCAPHAGCKIATLVKDRFSQGAPESPVVSTGDFQQEPRAYVIASAGSLIWREWPLLMFGLFLIEGRKGVGYTRRQAGPRVSEQA